MPPQISKRYLGTALQISNLRSEWRQKRKLRELLRDPRAARGFRSTGQFEKGIAADRPTTDTACGQKWRPIAIIRRSCSDSLLTASQMD
jgi:hypothetical protein